MRRVHLRGRDNILKRLLLQAAAFNISLILRAALGTGKPRQLQGLEFEIFALYLAFLPFFAVDRQHSSTLCTAKCILAGHAPANRE